jgi:hypothetical protein
LFPKVIKFVHPDKSIDVNEVQFEKAFVFIVIKFFAFEKFTEFKLKYHNGEIFQTDPKFQNTILLRLAQISEYLFVQAALYPQPRQQVQTT